MNRLDMATCEGCDAGVTWLVNDKTRRRAPVDQNPSEDGNVTVDFEAGTYHVLTKAEKNQADDASLGLFPAPLVPRFTLHFATCPKAKHFRRCSRCHHTPCTCERTP